AVAAAGAAAASAAGASAAGAAAALALPSVSIRARTSPATTVAPSPLTISFSTPAAGAGTSRTTLSVSTSIRISSISTASPGCFFHSSRVASEIDSESCGTTTSVIAISVSVSGSFKCLLFAQREALELRRHGGFQQCTLLLNVLGQITHGRRRRSGTTCVTQLLAFFHVLEQVVLNVEPRTLVLRFVLYPDDFGRIRVFGEFRFECLVCEGVQLFNADDRDIAAAAFLTCVDQVVVDLAGASDDSGDGGRVNGRVGFADDGLEVTRGQIFQRRGGILVAQQRLGREDHERLAELANHLATQQME